MKRIFSLAVVVSVLALGAAMLFAEDNVANTGVMRQAGPAYFYNAMYYAPSGTNQVPAIITGTATNGQTAASFGVTFKSAPMVLMRWKETQVANGGTNELWATSITTTNFAPSSTMSLGLVYTNIYWMAIGPLY